MDIECIPGCSVLCRENNPKTFRSVLASNSSVSSSFWTLSLCFHPKLLVSRVSGFRNRKSHLLVPLETFTNISRFHLSVAGNWGFAATIQLYIWLGTWKWSRRGGRDLGFEAGWSLQNLPGPRGLCNDALLNFPALCRWINNCSVDENTRLLLFWWHDLNWNWVRSWCDIRGCTITLTHFPLFPRQGKEGTKSSYYKSLTPSWWKDKWTLADGWSIALLCWPNQTGLGRKNWGARPFIKEDPMLPRFSHSRDFKFWFRGLTTRNSAREY